MRLLITGATGFVGRNLADGLAGDGHEVVATGRSAVVGAELERHGIEFRPADLVDPTQVRDGLSPADCVIHCGGKSGPWGSYRAHFEANVVGTRSVVSACRAHGISRLVFVSTPSIYFTRDDRFEVREDEPLPRRQFNHYSTTKLMAEKELEAASEDALQVITLRPRAVHGPWDGIFIPRILRMAEGKSFPLVGGGEALVDVTFVGNFVDAVRQCLEAPDEAWNEIYNIANDEPLTVKEWFSGVVEAFDLPFRPKAVPAFVARAGAVAMEAIASLPGVTKPPRMTRASVDYLASSMTMSVEKARNRLGFSPKIGNAEGFRLTAKWFQSRDAEKG